MNFSSIHNYKNVNFKFSDNLPSNSWIEKIKFLKNFPFICIQFNWIILQNLIVLKVKDDKNIFKKLDL